MTIYDIAVAWNWPHDSGFIRHLTDAFSAYQLSVLEITPDNLNAAIAALTEGSLAFRAFMNRAADTDASFLPLVRWSRENEVFRINPHERETYTADKATMHLELISSGVHTPYTIILPPFVEQPIIPPLDLAPLAGSFAIKPALGGGGQGVVLEASTEEQVLQARQRFPADKYLVQAHVEPLQLRGRPAWFRVIYCVGQLYVSWWPPDTHIYDPVSKQDVIELELGELYDIALRIARVSRLHLFSTEIAKDQSGQLLAVDYVNDQIDLRLQSQAVDGVPDDVVADIANRLAGLVSEQIAVEAPTNQS